MRCHSVLLELGGDQRRLLFDFNAVCRAEEATGLTLMSSLNSYATARGIRAMVWAALVSPLGEKRPTLETVGKWIGEIGVEQVTTVIMEAWMKATEPDDAEGEKGGADDGVPLAQ